MEHVPYFELFFVFDIGLQECWMLNLYHNHYNDNNNFTEDHLSDWKIHSAIQPGSVTLNDYDFKAPKKQLLSSAKVPREHAQADRDIFDFPGEYAGAQEEGYCHPHQLCMLESCYQGRVCPWCVHSELMDLSLKPRPLR